MIEVTVKSQKAVDVTLQGNVGASAYSIAKKYGYNGTEEQYAMSPVTATTNADNATSEAVTATQNAIVATDRANDAADKAYDAASKYTLWYGVEWDSAVSSPIGTRIGNSELHRTLPIQNRMRGCLLDDNGNVVQYLNSSTWIGQDRSGASGQVMVEIPNYYFKMEQDGTKFRACISEYPLAGYIQLFPSDKKYVYCSAYEASLQRSTLMLSSVVNNSTDYRGGDNTSDWDNTYRSLLGMPATRISLTDFRTYARKRNANATTQWNEYVYTMHVMIAWLFYIEYATLNSQSDYNAQSDANGYKQGGLGEGVSYMPAWDAYNHIYPIIPCGTTDSLGNMSGVVDYNVKASDDTTYYVAKVPRYRGIENPFGHIYEWTDGINIIEDGTTKLAYVTNDPSKFSDSSESGYENRGEMGRTNGYSKQMLLGIYGDLLAKEVGGGSSTYWCDYYVQNLNVNKYCVRVGGDADFGSLDGFGCVNASYGFSSASASIGSRLCFIP